MNPRNMKCFSGGRYLLHRAVTTSTAARSGPRGQGVLLGSVSPMVCGGGFKCEAPALAASPRSNSYCRPDMADGCIQSTTQLDPLKTPR